MYQRFSTLILLFTATFAAAQTASVRPSYLSGDVVSIAASAIVLRTTDGQVNVELTEKTSFKRVPAGKPSLSAAVDSSVSEIAVGDRLVVSGILSDNKRSIPARSIYLMTSSDISQQKQAEDRQWSTRGISGRVKTANAETGQVEIEVRGLMGTQTVTVTPKPNAKFRRYKQDSIKYSESLESKFGDIQAGDTFRAVGDRSTDGLGFAAEEIVTGAFKTVVGTVKSVDTAANEIVITDLQTKRDIIVAVSSSSALKKIPDEMAQRMSQIGGARQGGGSAPAAGQPATPGPRPGGAGRPRAAGARGIDALFERFPTITPADLKAGEMIAVSSSRNGSAEKITAIKLLAGVEPFVRAQAQNAGGRGRTGQSGGFTIPGLDGVDFP